MAFPLDNAHLIDHIRTSLLLLSDSDGEGNEADGSNDLLRRVFFGCEPEEGSSGLSSSPPITFNVARHLQNTMQKLASDTHGIFPRATRRDIHSGNYIHGRDRRHQKHSRKLSRIVEKQVTSPSSHLASELGAASLKEEEEDDMDPTSEDNSETPEFAQQSPSTIILNNDKPESSDGIDKHRRASTSTVSDESSLSSMSTARRSTSLTYSSKIRRSTSHRRSVASESELTNDTKSDKSKKKHMVKFRQYIGKKWIGSNDSDEDSNSDNDGLNNPELDHIAEEQPDFSDDDNSDALTIDSDFGVAVAKNGHVVKNIDPEELEKIKNRKLNHINGERKAIKTRVNDDQFLDEDDTYLNEEDDSEEDDDEDDEDDDDEYIEDDYDDDGESYESGAYEDELGESTFSDSDSASMLDSSSLLLLSYNKSQSYIFGSNGHTVTDYGQLTKKRKKKRGSFADTQSTKHTLTRGIFNNSVGKIPRISSAGNFQQIKGLAIGKEKKQSLFRKVDITEVDNTTSKQSNLSSLIKSRYKLSHSNPLSYYIFANLEDELPGVRRVKLDIFLPPNSTPTLQGLSINSNVAIVDCIGYALLSLTTQIEEYKNITDIAFYDPNNWRLELVDEDGDNYGEFGILDRTRLLSSYNCPQQLALCKVEKPEEVIRNEKVAPLPSEFKQSLTEFQMRSKSAVVSGLSGDQELHESVDILITLKGIPHDFTQQDTYRMTVPGNLTIGQLMQQFCLLSGMDPMRWKFRESSETLHHDFSEIADNKMNPFLRGSISKPTSKSYFSPVLSDSQSVSTLTNFNLGIVPNSAYSMILSASAQGTNNSNDVALNSMITPPANGLTSLITPTTLDEKLLNMTLDGNRNSGVVTNARMKPTPQRMSSMSSAKSRTKFELEKANKYLHDIMTGKSTMEMPPNINTVYFKWKVWRKKPTILNKIEKSLIIDGDYVHLAPTDDITFRDTNNPFSNPSGGHSNNHHHHHHLYYYNYNNYYKELMLKTSSFHITQISKVKQYKNDRHSTHFKIVVSKPIEGGKETLVKKKYELEASSSKECQEIIDKLKWVMQVYKLSTAN